MAPVAPALERRRDLTDSALQVARRNRWAIWGFRLARAWRRMQVSYYGGKYSIQRVLALEEYTNKTSLARVIFVCACSPLPMMALVFGQESIPLQELSEGWQANYGMWIRAAVVVSVVTYGVVVQGVYLIDDFTVSTQELLVLLVWMPIATIAASMVISAYVVFPIPFYILLMMPMFFFILIASLRVVVGSRAIHHMLEHRDQSMHCIRFVCVQASTLAIFPAYELLFRAAEGTHYQLFVILLLPALKVAAKNVVLHFAKSLEDMIPVEVIFTADYFNAVYVATWMQSASSVSSVVAITLTDLSQTIFMLYGLQRRTSRILSTLHRTVGDATDNDNMLSMICWLCRHPDRFERQAHGGIRRRSCLPHQISSVNTRVLDSLNQFLTEPDPLQPHELPRVPSLASTHQNKPAEASCLRAICSRKRINAMDAIAPDSRSASRKRPPPPEATTYSPRPTILLRSLEALFTTECLLITAYLEAFMPLFYTTYMMVMVHLSSARYHREMTGITRDNVVITIVPLLLFGALQVASFVVLVMLIKNNCGMRALYQLAFVLEKQRSLVQCKMMLWMLITLCFRVQHFGIDFKFDYIRQGFPKLWTPHITYE
ncbi:hypothetical protein PR001_g3903 [Phytophthora rubi]|uniref:Transmembrane protein n=1 Tax=Phytophthora rubi TaxID=129364 RepID=A0A6A3NCI7_9STRA|nr:hypothetical protein PR002_g4113 [Phytophthora rubi]KAE9048231.1 hypothetical protein PR001_g3903 [Phytophthora rubi]